MKNSVKKVFALLLIAVLVIGTFPATSFAATTYYEYVNSNTNGKAILMENKYSATDTSLMNVRQKDDTSNKFTAYCLDFENGLSSGSHNSYTISSLESISYLTNASKIRAIVNNSFPVISVDTLQARVNAGLSSGNKISQLTSTEAVTAIQAAIWKYSNNRNVNWTYWYAPGIDKNDVYKVYNYLTNLPGESAPALPQIQATQPTATSDGTNIVIQFNYKNLLANPTISLSLTGFTKTEASVSDGWTQVTFKKSLASATAQDFGSFTVSLNGKSNYVDVFAFNPKDGRDKTQTLVSTGLNQPATVTKTVTGTSSNLLGSVTINKSFSDNAATEVSFKLLKNNVVINTLTTQNHSLVFSNLVPGNYSVQEVTPAHYTSSIANGTSFTLTCSENKVLNVTNTAIPKTVLTVHHVSEANVTLAADQTFSGYAEENYSINAATIPHYTVLTKPATETGLFGNSNFEVTYVYKEDPKSKVTAIYVDEDDNILAAPEEVVNYVGQSYTTAAKTINHYALIDTPVNATGTHDSSDITVKYIYVENDKSTVYVYYVDEDNNTLSPSDSMSGYAGESYTTSPAVIAHYTLITTPDNANGIYAEDDATVTYVYREDPKTTITIKHQDAEGHDLVAIATISGYADEAYSTSSQSIPNYTLSSTPANSNGVYGDSPFDVVYVYTPDDKLVLTVKHVDEDNVSIASDDIIKGYPLDPYTTSSKSINGYQLKTTPENASGSFGETSFDVIYIYEKVETTEPQTQPSTQPPVVIGPLGVVNVNYYDESGNQLAPSIQLTGEVNTNYSTQARSFADYELVEVPLNASGYFSDSPITINYIYSNSVNVVEEEVALGENIKALNFDSIYDNMEMTTVAEEVIVEEGTPLADALPKTGQASPELFYGIGSLITAAGVFLKRKEK